MNNHNNNNDSAKKKFFVLIFSSCSKHETCVFTFTSPSSAGIKRLKREERKGEDGGGRRSRGEVLASFRWTPTGLRPLSTSSHEPSAPPRSAAADGQRHGGGTRSRLDVTERWVEPPRTPRCCSTPQGSLGIRVRDASTGQTLWQKFDLGVWICLGNYTNPRKKFI